MTLKMVITPLSKYQIAETKTFEKVKKKIDKKRYILFSKAVEGIKPSLKDAAAVNTLRNAISDNFNQLKSVAVKGRISNMWKAKFNLFGEHCQVFTWGGDQHSYSCSLVAPDEESAKRYYQNAKSITQGCLGNEWQLEEKNRTQDAGMKASFTQIANQSSEQVTFSTQLVPSSGFFSTTWSIYYYVGDITEPKKNQ